MIVFFLLLLQTRMRNTLSSALAAWLPDHKIDSLNKRRNNLSIQASSRTIKKRKKKPLREENDLFSFLPCFRSRKSSLCLLQVRLNHPVFQQPQNELPQKKISYHAPLIMIFFFHSMRINVVFYRYIILLYNFFCPSVAKCFNLFWRGSSYLHKIMMTMWRS